MRLFNQSQLGMNDFCSIHNYFTLVSLPRKIANGNTEGEELSFSFEHFALEKLLTANLPLRGYLLFEMGETCQSQFWQFTGKHKRQLVEAKTFVLTESEIPYMIC